MDRYSNWPIVFQEPGKAENLIRRLRDIFETFGVPEELTSDGGPQFTADITEDFLKSWGVHHRLASVSNPHANSRAEIAVKTVKRMLQANTSAIGSLNVDAFQRAMLIYRNSIDPETKTSPAMVLFGRPLRDPIPAPLGRYCPHQTWQETIANRERALAIRHSREREKWSEHTRELKPLEVGDHVYVQNVVGNNPLKWERTGIVVEALEFRQYKIKLDGSGRITLRNRRHLRKFTPFYSRPAKQMQPVQLPAADTVPTERPEYQEPIVNSDTPGDPSSLIEAPHIDTNTNDPPPIPRRSLSPQPTISHEAVEPVSTTPQVPQQKPKEKKIPLALRRLLD